HRCVFPAPPERTLAPEADDNRKRGKGGDAIQNRIVTFESLHPCKSNRWCNGAILKPRFPRSLNEPTWMMKDKPSPTNTSSVKASSNSCWMIAATVRSLRRARGSPHRPTETTLV